MQKRISTVTKKLKKGIVKFGLKIVVSYEIISLNQSLKKYIISSAQNRPFRPLLKV